MSVQVDKTTSTQPTLDRATQLARLVDALGLDPEAPLSVKARHIVEGIIQIWQQNGGHFQRVDAETIQALVLAELSPEDFREIARLSFAKWATPARLSGPGLPHLNRINDRLGQKVAALAKRAKKSDVRLLDLGAGLLSTTESVARALARGGARLDVTAVDATPALVDAARTKREQLLVQYPQLQLQLHQGDMLEYLRQAPDQSYDYITISFAIHHLHPSEQMELVREAWRVLKVPGALLVADPQEGKSDFNLTVLIYEEPEAIFASFTSPDSMRQMLKAGSFERIEVLIRDDTGFEGYAVSGEKRAPRARAGSGSASRQGSK